MMQLKRPAREFISIINFHYFKFYYTADTANQTKPRDIVYFYHRYVAGFDIVRLSEYIWGV